MTSTNNHITLGPDHVLEVHGKQNGYDVRYHIRAPFYLSLIYNRSGIPGQVDSYFSIAPGKAPFYVSSSSITENDSSGSALTASPHRHDYFEFLLVLKGKVIQRIEDKEYLYTAGSCCLINRNIVHVERYIGECTILFLAFSNEFIQTLMEEESLSLFPGDETPMTNSIFRFMQENIHTDEQKDYLDFFPTFQNQNSAMHLHNIGDRLVREMFFPALGSTYMLKAWICELFRYLDSEEMFHTVPVKLHSSADYLLFSRIRNLLEDTDGRLSRYELEEALHYSGNYLNTIVKRYTGMCLFDYGMSFCLEKAKWMLKNTNVSVSAIAEKLQFTNRTHFYKLFKKEYGMTPQEYRKGF